MLFPLPLTPFEYYYWSDDRPEYPMTFPVDLRFSGKLEREPFLTALRQALDHHPLLDARIDERTSRPQWVPSGQPMPWVDWANVSVPILHPAGEYIDLRDDAGLRIWVRTDERTTRVLLQIHHACCDGIAALNFIDYLLVCYTLAVGIAEKAPVLPELDLTRLAGRGNFAGQNDRQPSLAIALRDIWITAREWSAILLASPALLAIPKREVKRPSIEPANSASAAGGAVEKDAPRQLLEFEIELLSGEQAGQLRRMAHAQGATLNDVLLRDLFFAICDWNQGNAGSSRKRFRLTVPVNLRGCDDEQMPAANRLGFAFISHHSRECGDRYSSLAAIHAKMERIKQRKLGLYFLGGLAFAGKLRGLVPWALRRNRSFATMVLSNLGRAFAHSPLPRRAGRLVCGNVVLDQVAGVPPIRPLTRAAIAVIEYADGMTISLRSDPRFFRREETRALLDTYVARLNETAQYATRPVGQLHD